jgi:hypothetical protein
LKFLHLLFCKGHAFRAAHPSPRNGQIMNTFFMWAPTREEAMATDLAPCNGHLKGLAVPGWPAARHASR